MGKEKAQLGFEGDEPTTSEHWQDLPRYEQPEGALPLRTLHVHFAAEADVLDFMRRIDQVFQPTTRYIWHPKSEKAVLKDKRWVDAPDEVDDEDIEILGEGEGSEA